MNLVDAVRLLPGDRIVYAGDTQVTAEWGMEYRGTVIKVTARGGILIEEDGGYEHWLAYNHVRRVEHVRRRPSRARPIHDQRAVREIIKRVVIRCGRDVAADVLERAASVGHIRDMLPQDYDAVYGACEQALADADDRLRADLGDMY